jgi:hypothetical protein
MKMLALLIALSGFAHAAEVTVECNMSEITTSSQFSLVGTFENTSGTIDNASFVLDLRSAGTARETRTVDVTREATVVAFPAGQLTLKPFFVVTSVLKGDDVEFINLLVDYPAPLSSQVRLLDGTTFFSICKTK